MIIYLDLLDNNHIAAVVHSDLALAVEAVGNKMSPEVDNRFP